MTDRCPNCNAWIYSYDKGHECPPLWLVQCPEYDDETWDEVYAVAAEYAAESWAEEHDRNCSYMMLDGETIVVRVKRDPNDGWCVDNIMMPGTDFKTFTCSGEAVPTYTAEEIVEETDDNN